MKQPNPKRPHPPTPLGDLMNDYQLSHRQVHEMLLAAGARVTSRATIFRLVHNELSHQVRAHVNPILAKCLQNLLIGRGVGKPDIDARLQLIFNEGEYQPMISKRIELTSDECRWFNLKNDPFAEFPRDRREVYVWPDLQRVIDRVIDAIRYPAFISVIGEIGSGKTVIRAMVEDHCMSQPNIKVIWPEFFDQARVTPLQIARTVLQHLGVVKIPRYAADLGQAVKQTLEREFQSGSRISIAFDECHRLNDGALSSLKNFFEMGSGGFQRYVSVILFGQPVFESRLYDPKFRELNERIIPNPMPEFQKYAPEYLAHRLKIADADPELFDPEAVEHICLQATTPLQLGNIANQALRISKDEFENKTVIGSAIKTKMFFESRNGPQGFIRRNA